METTVGRNEPCPCGSGKKYKNCCMPKEAIPGDKSMRPVLLGIGIFIVLIAAGATVVNIVRESPVPQPSAPPAPPVVGRTLPQPFSQMPGDVVSEKVVPSASQFTPGPQPPGPVPEGKVWSTEHGHWHDAAATPAPAAFTPGPQPEGPVPEGKVWSTEHGHWHNIPGYVAPAPSTEAPVPASSAEDSVPAPSAIPEASAPTPPQLEESARGSWSRPSDVEISP